MFIYNAKQCPRCGFEYLGQGLPSIRDNKKTVCPNCSIAERSFDDFVKEYKLSKKIIESERAWTNYSSIPKRSKCVQCGYCCKVAPCPYGEWDYEKKQCKFLELKGEDYECQKYEEIKNDPRAEFSPAFGKGCCSSLNSDRQRKISNRKNG